MTATLLLKMSMSLDGYVAAPDGGGDWISAGSSPDALAWSVAGISDAAAHLMGATTYTVMARHWPDSASPFARPMNDTPKIVFSRSLTATPWGEATIVRGEPAAELARIKDEYGSGRLVAHGGAAFARSLVATGLIDEYRLLVHPVVLGGGERIFDQRLTLRPLSTTAFSGGAVGHVVTAEPRVQD